MYLFSVQSTGVVFTFVHIEKVVLFLCRSKSVINNVEITLSRYKIFKSLFSNLFDFILHTFERIDKTTLLIHVHDSS